MYSAFLEEHYDFKCTCAVCSLPKEESAASDARLVKITSLYSKFASWGGGEIDGRVAIDTVREIWKIEEEVCFVLREL